MLTQIAQGLMLGACIAGVGWGGVHACTAFFVDDEFVPRAVSDGALMIGCGLFAGWLMQGVS
jgi:hypothetical protein